MKPDKPEPFYYQIVEEILPNALLIGVSNEEFWSMTPKSLDPYYKAFSLQQKENDNMMWMNGMYMAMAIGSVLSKDVDYPKRPMIAQQELESNQELLAHKRMEQIKQRVEEQMIVVNHQLKKEGG